MENESNSTETNQSLDDNKSTAADNNAESESKKSESSKESAVNYESKINELNDKYLRLYSEFDNYRKRTVKEKSDLIKSAGEDVFKAIIPVIDDFERAIKANENSEDLAAIKEGVHLIYSKFKNSIQAKGLTAFETIGQSFDSEVMEAITHIPAADESQKNKVIDEIEKGYKLGDKVIRFAKVVIAQ